MVPAQRQIGTGSYYVAGEYLSTLRDYALVRGINLDQLLQNSGISLDQLLQGCDSLGDQSFQHICLNLMQLEHNPWLTSFEISKAYGLQAHGNLGVAAMSADNLHQVSEMLQSFFATRTSMIHIEMQTDSHGHHIQPTLIADIIGEPQQAQQLGAFMQFHLLMILHQQTLMFLGHHQLEGHSLIQMPGPKPDNFPDEALPPLCRFEFQQPAFCISFPSQWLNLAFSYANPSIAERALQACMEELQQQQQDICVELERQLLQLSDLNPGIQRIAECMNLSTSTLQRRLKEKDTTFQALKIKTRMLQARKLLQHPSLSIADIAEQLGFSDASNFNKSFKTHHGITPAQFRQNEN